MWLKESNRPDHIKYGLLSALVGTLIFTTGLAIGMEFKDKQYGGKFDWLDVAATIIGGIVGQLIQICIISLIYLTFN